MSAARSLPPVSLPLPAPRAIESYPKTQRARVANVRAMIERGEADWIYEFVYRVTCPGLDGGEEDVTKSGTNEAEARHALIKHLEIAGASSWPFTLVEVRNTNRYRARSRGR